MEWLKTEQTVLTLSGKDLVIMHRNVHYCSKQNSYCCRALSKAVQIFLPGKTSPSLSGLQMWNTQANLVFSLRSAIIDFKMCLSLSVGDNPRRAPVPESLLQVEELAPGSVIPWGSSTNPASPQPPASAQLRGYACVFFTSYGDCRFN